MDDWCLFVCACVSDCVCLFVHGSVLVFGFGWKFFLKTFLSTAQSYHGQNIHTYPVEDNVHQIFRLNYSCFEEYFIVSYKRKLLKYSLLLAVIPQNLLDLIHFLLNFFWELIKVFFKVKWYYRKTRKRNMEVKYFNYCRIDNILK